MSQYFPEPYGHFNANAKLEFDISHQGRIKILSWTSEKLRLISFLNILA